MFGSAFEIARRAQDLETRRQVFKAVRSWYRGCLVHVGFCCNSLNFENVLKAKVCGRITTSICLLNMNYHDYIVAFLSCERQKNNDVLWEAQVWLRQNLILKWHPDKNKEEIRAAEAAQSSLALIPFLFALSFHSSLCTLELWTCWSAIPKSVRSFATWWYAETDSSVKPKAYIAVSISPAEHCGAVAFPTSQSDSVCRQLFDLVGWYQNIQEKCIRYYIYII